jgi:hypothetical protein
MKSALIAVLTSAVVAQRDGRPPKTVKLSDGAGVNAKATSTGNVAIAVIPEVSGTVVASQVITYATPSSNNIVQSWMTFAGAADNGTDNVYCIANATFGSNVASATSISTSKVCGTATNMQAPGAQTVKNSLNTSGCSLAVVQTYVQVAAASSFTQTASAAMLPTATSGSLVLGSSLTATAGWNIYLNPAGTAAIVDSYAGSTATFTLDGALALTLSGAAAAVAALTF